MEKYFKITKLNLLANSEQLKFFGTLMGGTTDLPEEEIIMVNSDKIIGVSQVMKTGLKDDDRLCHKLYFAPNEYWVVKQDPNLLDLLEKL